MDIIQRNISLKDKCYYKIGGIADYFAEPCNNYELGLCLDYARDKGLDYEIIGGGANLLISDNGYKGLIISTAGLNRYILNRGGGIFFCGVGIKLFELINFAISRGLGGLESLSGIPGCVGGGIAMNAGAFGVEIKDVVSSIDVVDFFGKESIKDVYEAGFGYRKSEGLLGYIITGSTFKLSLCNKDELESKRKDILKRRKEKQPLDKPSCGSVFKRPINGYAGDFIERSGLKGFRVGGAVVSEKHANFILNDNNATSDDVCSLIEIIKAKVYENFSVELETEVKFIGF